MEDRRSLPPHEDELSLALLRSADHDEPSAAAYSKVATALGVSAAVGLGASLPAPAMLASNGLSASAAARWSSSMFAKVVVVGVSSVLLVAGGLALRAQRAKAHEQAQVVQRGAVASTAHVVHAPTLPTATDAPSVASMGSSDQAPSPANAPSPAGALVNAQAMPPLTSSVSSASPPVVVSSRRALSSTNAPTEYGAASESAQRRAKASSLPEQVLSLDRARVALNSGDASGALAEIAHYRNTWPRGVFLEEASVLEIEALAKRGEIVLAGMRAQAYVTAHPDSPQAARLRALIPGQRR